MEPIYTRTAAYLLFVSISSEFQMEHLFFRVVDLSSRAIRGEYGMSSQIGYKVIAALRYIFLRTNNQECFTITLGFRVQQGCPLY